MAVICQPDCARRHPGCHDHCEDMKLITHGLQHYSDLILRALTPYSESDAGLLVFALRHIADEIEKNNPAAKPLYEGMKKVVIAPPLTEIQKVKKANRL